MPVPPIHPLNLLWLLGDPSEFRMLGPTIRQVVDEALKKEGGSNPEQQAVIVGALQSPVGACLFDTEVIAPKHDAIELRPMYNTIFEVCDAIQDLIADGFPDDLETIRVINARARKLLEDRGCNPRAAHLVAEAAMAAIHLGGTDMMVVSLYPDGRLLFLKAKLLNETFLTYLDARQKRLG